MTQIKRRRERMTVRNDVGASGETRTPDLLITNQLLYRLSYTSVSKSASAILAEPPDVVNSFLPLESTDKTKIRTPGKKRIAVLTLIR